jgi:hypothetical protein
LRSHRARQHGRTLKVSKLLSKFDPVKFDEKSLRILVDIAQKPRFIANDSFKAVC